MPETLCSAARSTAPSLSAGVVAHGEHGDLFPAALIATAKWNDRIWQVIFIRNYTHPPTDTILVKTDGPNQLTKKTTMIQVNGFLRFLFELTLILFVDGLGGGWSTNVRCCYSILPYFYKDDNYMYHYHYDCIFLHHSRDGVMLLQRVRIFKVCTS